MILAYNRKRVQNTVNPAFVMRIVGSSFTIPTTGGGYNYDVDWGDGNTSTGQTGNASHTYAASGTYDISITGTFPRIYFNNTADSEKVYDILNWGSQVWTSFYLAFYGCINLNITATDEPDKSAIPSFEGAFNSCFTYARTVNISHWDMSGITNIRAMFYFNLGLNVNFNNWNTSSVTNAEYFAYFTTLSNINSSFSNWDVNQMSAMSGMFGNCILSTANYDATLISWAAQIPLTFNGTLDFGSSKYTGGGAAATARAALVTDVGAITDGGIA